MADVSDCPAYIKILCSLQYSSIYNAFWLRCKMYSSPFTKTIILLYKWQSKLFIVILLIFITILYSILLV